VCGLVLFEVELALEGLIDRLDDLPQWFEQRGSGPLRFARKHVDLKEEFTRRKSEANGIPPAFQHLHARAI